MRFVTGAIFIVISIAIFFGFTNPRYQGVKVIRDEVARYDEALDRAKDLTALRDELNAKYSSFSPDEIDSLNTLLPDTIDTVRLIIDVNNIADRHNLTLLNISVAGGPDQNKNQNSGAIGPSGNDYGTIELSFNVSTTYDQFKTFLSDLERSMRLIDVKNISFGAAAEGTGLTTYSVQAETYWLR